MKMDTKIWIWGSLYPTPPYVKVLFKRFFQIEPFKDIFYSSRTASDFGRVKSLD